MDLLGGALVGGKTENKWSLGEGWTVFIRVPP